MSATKLKLTLILLVLFVFSGMISCSKKTEQKTDNDQKIEVEKTSVDDKDFTESDEDLLKVDYKEFYDELSPHGEWIEVTDKDIQAAMKHETSYRDGHKVISFSELFGVNDAYASAVEFGAFFVWKPAPDVAVSVAALPEPAYVPYTNGSWVYTDAGWYFRAPTDYEEITSHYGRWALTPAMGWVWVPGRVWSPAWVDWREDDQLIAWEPIPPAFYIVNDVVVAPPVYVDRYIVVEKTYFYEPEIYKYVYSYGGYGTTVNITEMRRLDGVMVVNNTVVNRGPNITIIQNIHGSPIEMVTINKVKEISDVKFKDKVIYTYAPQFSKVKIKSRISEAYSKPGKFDKFNDYKIKHESRSESGDNNKGKIENKKEDKTKLSDDKNMYNGNKKGKDKNTQKWENKKKDGTTGNRNNENGRNKNDGSYRDKGGNKKNDGDYKDKGRKNNDGGNQNKGGKNDGGYKDKGGKNKSNGSPGNDKGGKNKDNGNIDKGNKKGGKHFNSNFNNGGRVKGKDSRYGNKNDRKVSKEYFRNKGRDTQAPRDKNSNSNNRSKDKSGSRKNK
jgi:uncharacterized protein DUF6600